MGKVNCWEFKKCGREANGANVKSLGVCPASREAKLNGVHGGSRAGRSCWVMAGTLCKGEVQGTFAQKYQNCSQCDFYVAVRKEEGNGFMLAVLLLSKLKRA
jgi:hypothetical protein